MPGFAAPGTCYTERVYEQHLGSVSLIGVFVTVLFLALSSAAGYSIIQRISPEGTPFSLKIFAAFLPGYLVTVAIVRVITLFIPHSFAPVCVFILLSAISVYNLSPSNGGCPPRMAVRGVFSQKGKNFIILLPMLMLFFVLAVHLRYDGSACYVGDGLFFFLTYMITDLIPPVSYQAQYLPIVTQHYDQLAFSYPVPYLLSDYHLIFLQHWFGNSLAKISVSAFFFIIFRKYGVSFFLSTIFCMFILFGNFSADPRFNLYMIDNGNPLGLAIDIGRAIAVGVPWLFLSMFLSFLKSDQRPRLADLAALVLLGVGLSSLNLHVFAFVTIIMLLFYILRPMLSFSSELFLEDMYILEVSFLLCIAALLFGYALSTSHWSNLGGALHVMGIVFSSVLVLRVLLHNFRIGNILFKGRFLSFKHGTYFLLPFLGAVIGIVFLGNLLYKTDDNVRIINSKDLNSRLDELFYENGISISKYLSEYGPASASAPHGNLTETVSSDEKNSDRIVLARPMDLLLRFVPFSEPPSSFMSSFMNRPVFYHKAIVLYFGQTLFWALIVVMFTKNHCSSFSLKKSEPAYFASLLFALSTVMMLLFLVFSFTRDFGGTYIWVQTRLIELPLYWFLVGFCFTIGRYAGRFLQSMTVLYMVTWSITPIFYSDRFQQWAANLTDILDAFSR
ncbi:MAG: hypothetical protein HW380_2659 [Magnetococcales bacterium]|nr:hypothetical protein [Magnetococcales bacterium]